MAGAWKKYFDEELEKAFDEWSENKTTGSKIDFKCAVKLDHFYLL